VNPTRIPLSGQYAIIVLRDGADTKTGERRCMVKEFVRRTPTAYTLKQYNPERTFDVPRDEVESVHLVTGIKLV
jgi:phage repressor protein C with HTH and peptisase S24 domain